jgi:thioredoxin 1
VRGAREAAALAARAGFRANTPAISPLPACALVARRGRRLGWRESTGGIPMATQELTPANFEEHTDRDGITVVDFWAEWCGPCKQFAPVFERVSEKNPDILFGKVDTQSHPDLAATFNVEAIPTLLVIRDRVVLYAQAGALPQPALEDLLQQARDLDMEQVRREAGIPD